MRRRTSVNKNSSLSNRLLAWIVLGGVLLIFAHHIPAQGAITAPLQGPTPTPLAPFLYPPFADGYRITAHLDHQRPDYTWDDTVVLYTGEQAHAIDGIWGRTLTFRGGYWQPESARTLWYDGHGGVDYALPLGTTVLAAAPGEVIFAGTVPSGCATPLTYVSLLHENGTRTYYLHLSGVTVRKSDRVEAGDPVGLSGSSGCSTGFHLHFGVEHEGRLTDPYGWQDPARPDPLAKGGAPATWLWAAAPPTEAVASPLTGRLISPGPDLHANGDLLLAFAPDPGCPPLARVEFWAYYASALAGETRLRWHRIGIDRSGQDGWAQHWDTRAAPEGPVWLHAWAVDETGRVGKGSPIHTGVTVDRHPPLGRLVGLLPGGAAGREWWLYVLADDLSAKDASPGDIAAGPDTGSGGVRQVDLLARPNLEQSAEAWVEIGRARQLDGGEWLLIWEPARSPLSLAEGAVVDLAARLTDRAGNSALTAPVEGLTLDENAPLGQVTHPPSGVPLTATVDLVFVPTDAQTSASIDRVAFQVWYDEEWHEVGVDENGLDGWQARWDPARVEDQSGVRVSVRPSSGTTVYTALPQVTGLALDRTPPRVGYVRPRSQGVARPDVAQSVWAVDAGSGVARVEFYADWGEGQAQIGADENAAGGWTLEWDAAGVPDGPVDFVARAVDRAGNAAWSEVQREVALDRAPPVGALRVEQIDSATHAILLDVTDEGSGLERAIFYARSSERGGWRHLGADTEPEDGLGLQWESGALGITGPMTLTAWVYDRAGNQVELPHVGGVWIEAAAALPTPTPTAQDAATATLPAPTRPVETPTQAITATATQTLPETAAPTFTATGTATPLPSQTAVAAATETPRPSVPLSARPRTDTLIAVVALGLLAVLVGAVGLVWSVRRMREDS